MLPLLLGLLTTALPQDLPEPAPTDQVLPGRYLVQFAARSFDLTALRRPGPGADRAATIADFERRVRADQADFVAAVEARGARVTAQWWIINGAAVADAGDGAWLRDLPGVARVEPELRVRALNDVARNAAHHAADAANLRRNANGDLVTGAGVAVAVLDTGSVVEFGQTSRPHPAYYVGGDQADASGQGIRGSRLRTAFDASGHGVADINGHGAHVEGSVASDHPGYRGIAPGAWIVGVRISGPGGVGWAESSSLVTGWQMVAAARVEHAIAVANNSFSGSPDIRSAIQVALDNAAFYADVLPVCAAGNSRGDTSASQNVWNGLAVGSIDKSSLAISSFSARGPLDGFGRTYPDITAVGNGVLSTQVQAVQPTVSSGTSMASPMVAGAAALVRDAAPWLGAAETKALLLNTTRHTQNRRNDYGLGVLDCDAAVAAAIAGSARSIALDAASGVHRETWTAAADGPMSITIAWLHPGGQGFDDLDLTIRSGTTVVATDHNRLNSYESVDFAVRAGLSYELEIRRVGAVVVPDLEVAIAGLAVAPTTTPPSLVAIAPATVANRGTDPIVLTGVLPEIRQIRVGPHVVTDYLRAGPDRIEFVPPARAVIGVHPVTVTNAAGTSAPLPLTITGTRPARLVGDSHRPKGDAFALEVLGDAGFATLLFLSPDAAPSRVPRVVDLAIGADFTSLFEVGFAVHDARGVAALAPVIPLGTPIGLWWFQGIHVDLTALRAPLETTNVHRVLSY